jgi:hypothetical protein
MRHAEPDLRLYPASRNSLPGLELGALRCNARVAVVLLKPPATLHT